MYSQTYFTSDHNVISALVYEGFLSSACYGWQYHLRLVLRASNFRKRELDLKTCFISWIESVVTKFLSRLRANPTTSSTSGSFCLLRLSPTIQENKRTCGSFLESPETFRAQFSFYAQSEGVSRHETLQLF